MNKQTNERMLTLKVDFHPPNNLGEYYLFHLPDNVIFDCQSLQVSLSAIVVEHILPYIISTPNFLYLKVTMEE